MKLSFYFIFLFLSSLAIAQESPDKQPATEVESNEIVDDQADTTTTEVNEENLPELPSWLLESKFKLSLRVELEFDGSEDANKIERESESRNYVVHLNSKDWRAVRSLPFSNSTREYLHINDGAFIMTPSNRRVALQEDVSNKFWMDLVIFPYEMARKWSLDQGASNFEEWYLAMANQLEPLKNAEGDQIKVNFTRDENTQKMQLVMEGRYFHSSGVIAKFRSEWILEKGLDLQIKDLNESLLGGAG